MATPEEIRLLQEENRILRERENLQRANYDISVQVVESLKEVLGIRTRQSTFDQSILNTNKKIAEAILNQKTGLSSVKDITKQIEKNKALILKADLQNRSLLSTLSKEERTRLKTTEKSLEDLSQEQTVLTSKINHKHQSINDLNQEITKNKNRQEILVD